MSELNNLDLAHKAMIDAPDNEVARLAYYHCLADCELYMLLATEPVDGDMVPAIFSLETGTFVLVFDREERLADFAAGPVPYAVLPGRVIAGQLAGQGLGIGVNLGGSEGAFVMPPEAVDWLADALGSAPVAGGNAPLAYFAPQLPSMAGALAEKLQGLGALAPFAYLVGARFADGKAGHVLAFEVAHPAARAALAKAAGEAIQFSGHDPAGFEVMFLDGAEIDRAGLAQTGAQIAITVPQDAGAPPSRPAAPGSDPDKPPRLR